MRYSHASRCGRTFACGTAKKLTHFTISIAVLESVPPNAGLEKRATCSTLNVGVAGFGNQNRVTCVASSGTNRSAIHYAYLICTQIVKEVVWRIVHGFVHVYTAPKLNKRRKGEGMWFQTIQSLFMPTVPVKQYI
jgi:hypothetical protein